ncbi:MAG: hypothetical protein Q8R15_04035 [Candidatus Micrarchaeota archaeon]|nr:hypothetical protein [Candidatus Micrarchaeota archaeon]
MFIPLLFIATQLTAAQFSAVNMGCWATSNFFQSQPLAMNVEIPTNATQVMLTTSTGRGDYGIYNLRNCGYYGSCTSFGHYISTCPSIATFGFGTTNVTDILPPGSYRLTFDSIDPYGYRSTEITSAVLEVSSQSLFFNASDKQCIYNSSETQCSANVSTVGNGQCFYPSSAINASVSKVGETTPVRFSSNSTHVYWNCTTGNYSLQFLYLPISFNQSWSFTDSNLSRQHLLSTLQITNPNVDDFTNVPFSFNSSFDIESGEANGTTTLNSLQSKNLTALFSAVVINHSLPLSSSLVYFNFSASSLNVNLSVENSFSTPFLFSTSDLPLVALNCTENNFEIQAESQAVFSISCSPQVNYLFSNWSGLNATRVSTTLTMFGPATPPIFVSGVSQKLSEIFTMPITAEQDNFTYIGATSLNLTGGFVSISLQNESQFGKDALNYSLSLNKPPDLEFNTTVELDFSGYVNVSFSNESIPICPAVICLDGLILKVFVLNQTNFSILAFKPVQVESHVVSVSASPTSAGQRGGGGGDFPSYATEEINQSESSILENSEAEFYFNRSENNDSIPHLIPQATNLLPSAGEAQRVSPTSGFLTALPSQVIFALPLLLLACGAAIFFLRKPKFVFRKVSNGKTGLTVSNNCAVSMQSLELCEVLPLKAVVRQNACEVTESVIGKVLTWKKEELKPSEKWNVQYSSDSPARKAKLSFVQKGKKHAVLF